MLKSVANRVVLVLSLLAGCGTPGGPGSRVEKMHEQAAVIRPVMVAARGAEEMLKAIELIREKNYRQAEVNLEEIIKVRPDIAEAHFNLGWVQAHMGKHAEVPVSVRGGLDGRPQEINAYIIMGLSERESGQFREAEKSYLAALALAPDDGRLHLNIAILYDLYLFEPQRALIHYRRYQELQKTPDVKVSGWIVVLERREKK